MKIIVLIFASLVPAFTQVQTFTGVNGLGHSTLTCKDRDGDGYGVGPLVVVNTTISASTASGTRTVTPASMTGISAGSVLRIDLVANMERVLVTATTGSTFTGVFLTAHAGGITITDQGCIGSDADDNDPLVWTAAQAITKYGSIAGLLTKIGNDIILDNPIPNGSAAAIAAGYASPHATWYLAPASASPAGSDSNACNTISVPCLTFARLATEGYTTSDLVLLRDAWNGVCSPVQGTSAKYSVVLAYPGEKPMITSGGSNNCNLQGTQATPYDFVVIDGLGVGTSSNIGGGSQDIGSTGVSALHDILLRNIEGSGATGIGYIDFFNGLSNLTIEYSVLHDNNCAGGGCQHGTYNGSRMLASDHITYRRNISYRNGTNGLTFNGRCTACVFDQNISYSNGVSGLTLEMGVINSFVRSNLLFSNANGGLTIFDYPGDCATQGGRTDGAQICPFDQTGNLIENNTILGTGNANNPNPNGSAGSCAPGISYCGQAGINISNTTSPLAGNLGTNTYRNNIISSYGYTNHYPPVVYGDPASSGTCDSTCTAWVAADTWDHNDFFITDGSSSTTTIAFGPGSGFGFQGYTCTGAAAVTTMTNCLNAQPGFISSAIALWNTELQFDLRLLPSSSSPPALHAGSTTAIPAYDLAGRAFLDDTPSLGALERNQWAAGWNLMNGTGLSTAVIPANGAPLDTLTAAITLTTSTSFTVASGVNAFVGVLIGIDSELVCPSVVSGGSITVGNVASCNGGAGCSTATPGRGCGGTTAATHSNGATVYYNTFGGSTQGVSPATYYPFQTKAPSMNGVGAGVAGIGRDIAGQPKLLAYGGGGHTDYNGNEIYAIYPNKATPTTSLLTQPSTFAITGLDSYSTYYIAGGNQPSMASLRDGAWNSAHIINNFAYLPWNDTFCKFGGGYAGGNGSHSYDTNCLSLSTNTWNRFAGANGGTDTDCGNLGTGFSSCSFTVGHQFDPITATGCAGFSGMALGDQVTHSTWVYWTCNSGNSFITQYYDAVRQHVLRATGQPDLFCCGTTGEGSSKVFISDRRWIIVTTTHSNVLSGHKLDVSSATSQTPTASPNPAFGSALTIDATCTTGLNSTSPGMQYIPAIGQVLVYPGNSGGNTYYLMDPSALTCTSASPTGGPPASPTDPAISGMMQYLPSLDATVIVADLAGGANNPRVLSLNAPDPGVSAPAVTGGSLTSGNGAQVGNAVRQ